MRYKNNIIHLFDTDAEKRVEKMTSNTYEKQIRDLRNQKTYSDMPAVSEKLLALFSANTYPTQVIHIANNLGFRVFDAELEYKELSGIIAIDPKWKERFGSEKIIMVNHEDSNEHKRFAIAHELAHYLFDAVPGQQYYNTYRTTESQWTKEAVKPENREVVANYFAANLLMPSLDFRRKYNELKNTQKTLKNAEITSKLSEFFGVPGTAVQIRYKELDIEN